MYCFHPPAPLATAFADAAALGRLSPSRSQPARTASEWVVYVSPRPVKKEVHALRSYIISIYIILIRIQQEKHIKDAVEKGDMNLECED